jgi:predicted MFS family arabinose efflux permease
MSVSVVSLLLATVWGGVDYPWGSVQILGLFAASSVAGLLFIWQESRAKEPILPLRLFHNSIFRVSTLLSLLVGIVMFGALIFLPQYQQIVRGDSATKSGLMLLPFVAGMMTGSLGSGRLISKFGRYRIFPIIGSSLLIVSLWLFSHITADTNRAILSIWMLLLGLGIGQIMPVLTLAVQNGVGRKDLGTATSSVTFFRSIGSSLGAAMFGAILLNRLAHHLQQALPEAGAGISKGLSSSAASIQHLPPHVQQTIFSSFATSFSDVFKFGIPFAVGALVVSLFLKETPLRGHAREEAAGEGLEV